MPFAKRLIPRLSSLAIILTIELTRNECKVKGQIIIKHAMRVYARGMSLGMRLQFAHSINPPQGDSGAAVDHIPTVPSSILHRVIAEQLLIIFQQFPRLVVDYCRDVADYLRTLRNLTSAGEHCYVHLVRIQ